MRLQNRESEGAESLRGSPWIPGSASGRPGMTECATKFRGRSGTASFVPSLPRTPQIHSVIPGRCAAANPESICGRPDVARGARKKNRSDRLRSYVRSITRPTRDRCQDGIRRRTFQTGARFAHGPLDSTGCRASGDRSIAPPHRSLASYSQPRWKAGFHRSLTPAALR